MAENSPYEPIFPDEDFRFQVGIKRKPFHAFYSATPSRAEVLQQRNYWLDKAPQFFLAALPEAENLLEELRQWAAQWVAPEDLYRPGMHPLEALARNWEPDFLLLSKGSTQRLELKAGAVCFPSFWAMPEKLGLPVE